MADNGNDARGNTFSQTDNDDLQKKIAEQSLKSAGTVHEDPSRSALHYGEGQNADASGANMAESAPIAETDGPPRSDLAPDTPNSEAAFSEESAESTAGNFSAQIPDTPANDAHARPTGRQAMDDTNIAVDQPATTDFEQEVSASTSREAAPASSQSTTIRPDIEPRDAEAVDVNDAPTAVDLSNTAIAENVEGAVVGQLSVTDLDAGDSHHFEISDDRFEVVDGTVKLKDGVSLNHDDAASVSFDVTATDSAGASFTQSFDIMVADMPDISHDTGFHAKYYDMNERLRELDDVNWDADPTHQELVKEIDYENSRDSFWEGGSTDTFGVQITGNIDVEEGGTFDFYIGGDDGVVLYVNGVEVIDNDGLHGFRTRSGEIELEPGTHSIEVRYFENTGHAGLKLEWEGPGTDGRALVTAPGADDLQTVSGMPVALSLDVETMDASGTTTIQGLPPGSTVDVGDQVLEVGETGAVDVTGMDLSLLQITPPTDFSGDVAGVVTTSVSLGEGAEATQSYPLDFEVSPAEITPLTIDVQTGFKASYFDVDHGLSRLDQIDWDGSPTHEEVVSEVNYENGRGSFWEGGSQDTFGAKITGEVTIEEGGTYDFFIGGDDGVVLYINGEEVIDNDGLHGFRTRSGEIELEPGTHEIEVRYFENYGSAGLKLEWEGPDTNGRELVQADTEMNTEPNGKVDIRLETADLGDSGFATIGGLPPDTILVSGEMTAVSDGTEMNLEGWNLDLLEIMPPVEFSGEINAEVTVSMEAFNGARVESSTSFQIQVESDNDALSSSDGPDDLMLMDQSEVGQAGWVELSDAEDSTDGDGDDVMQEAVETNSEAEANSDVPETYERQDW